MCFQRKYYSCVEVIVTLKTTTTITTGTRQIRCLLLQGYSPYIIYLLLNGSSFKLERVMMSEVICIGNAVTYRSLMKNSSNRLWKDQNSGKRHYIVLKINGAYPQQLPLNKWNEEKKETERRINPKRESLEIKASSQTLLKDFNMLCTRAKDSAKCQRAKQRGLEKMLRMDSKTPEKTELKAIMP